MIPDGTTNFVKRLPHFAVSIAFRIKGRTEVAVVYDPMRNELFSAVRGQGAQLNGYRLRGATARDLDGAVLATGFPFKAKQHADTYIKMLGKLFTRCSDFRRTGSAALDLAYLAAGRVDGFFEIGLKPWTSSVVNCWSVKRAVSLLTSPVTTVISTAVTSLRAARVWSANCWQNCVMS